MQIIERALVAAEACLRATARFATAAKPPIPPPIAPPMGTRPNGTNANTTCHLESPSNCARSPRRSDVVTPSLVDRILGPP
jgi:hypothetical protein